MYFLLTSFLKICIPPFNYHLFRIRQRSSLFSKMKEGEAILVKIVEAISERLEVKYSIRTTTKSEQFHGKKVQVLRSSILKTYQYNMIIPLQLQVLFQPIFRKYFHGDAHAWWIWMAFQLTSGEPQVLGLYHTGKSSFSCGKRNWIYFKGKPEKSEMGEIRARFGQLAEFKEMNRKQSLNRSNFIFDKKNEFWGELSLSIWYNWLSNFLVRYV